MSLVWIFVGAKTKFEPLDNSECSSEETEYDDKLTTVLLGFLMEFEP